MCVIYVPTLQPQFLQINIPIFLYISIELAKLAQLYLIHHDTWMYDKVHQKQIECKTFTITEDLIAMCCVVLACRAIPLPRGNNESSLTLSVGTLQPYLQPGQRHLHHKPAVDLGFSGFR